MNKLKQILTLIGLTLVAGQVARAQDDFLEQETAAIRAVVERVADAVVRVELVGVVEAAGEVSADAPTVGTVIDPDGWIIASSQVTAQPAASILIVTADGTRQTARVVAKDTSREIVLLKTESENPMAAVSLPTEANLQVGQYAIAVGRVAGSEQAAVSVGILSATGRLNGRALQTDARVSPIFYGGPLLDIRGQIVGILVPAMPEAAGADEKSGWYDSGIAFAAPAEGIAKRLEKMKAGEDISPGFLGIVAGSSDPYAAGTKVDAVRPRSPAQRAGVQPNDEIAAIDGVPVRHQYEIKQELGRFDAGDEVIVKVRREGGTLELKATLAASIPPLELQTIGVYAQQSDEGVRVIGIEPQSAAMEAGIQIDDRFIKLDDQAIESLDSLRNRIATSDPELPAKLVLQRGDKTETVTLKVKPVAGPLAVLPAREDSSVKPDAWEIAELTLPDVANQVRFYAPKKIDEMPVNGLLMVLLDPGKRTPKEALERWQTAARELGVAVAAIQSADQQRWTAAESDVVGRAATQLAKRLGLRRTAVAVTGDQAGPSFAMALVVAITEKEAISGVATSADVKPPAIRLRENDVDLPLQLALPIEVKDELPTWAGILPKLGFPIIRTNDLQPQTLLRWVRTLTRI